MMNEKNPLVSICCITYNQENYIRDTLEGFLIQKITFPIEIVIHDDASTDATAKIIQEYANKYPELFVTILQKENQWSKGGGSIYARFVFPRARGKYIALCEGDDYWTDPLKLQKQVGFLEENEEYGLIYSKAKVFNNKEQIYEMNTIGKAFNNRGLLLSNPIPTLTTVFRKSLYQRYILEVEPENKNWNMGDYSAWLWFSFNSKIYFLDEITATYRVLTESASNSSDGNKRFQFNLSSFNVADYYAKSYCNDEEYEGFLEHRYLLLYLSGVIKNITKKNEYIRRLRGLKRLRWKTKFIILIFHDLKFANLFYLIFRSHILGSMLRNWGDRIF